VTADHNIDQHRHLLLASVLERVRAGLQLADLFDPHVDLIRTTTILQPIARATTVVDWIAANGDRVDAVITADETQWRVVFGSATGHTIDWLNVYERPPRFAGVIGGCAIVVNGPSGAGKSTLLHALQQIATVPIVVLDEPEHIGTVQPAYLVWRDRAPMLHRGYLQAIGALARCGNYVGVAAAGHHQREIAEAFKKVQVLSVGLTCALDVLNHRERRTGRWGGIAAASLDVHDGWSYDIQFDTTDEPNPQQMARHVLDHLSPIDAQSS
jgi:chloramphenicol 3-O-phosphotransferase